MPNTNEALTLIANEGMYLVPNEGMPFYDMRTYANYIQSEEANTPFDDITSSFHHLFVKDSVRDYLLSENVFGGFADAIRNDEAFSDGVYGDNWVYQLYKRAYGGKQTIEDLGNG